MPVHDWSRVDAGIFHDFHHAWIEEIKRALNSGLLPPDYYAMAEQHAAGFGPDVLTLETAEPTDHDVHGNGRGAGLLLAPPKVQLAGETDLEFYRRKQKLVAVRHVSGDHLVAVIEVVSPGNKSSRKAMSAFVAKAAEFLDRQIHLLILDLHLPGPRDPHGIHAVIWEEITGQEYAPPADKPLTLAAYESGLSLKAYVEPFAVRDVLKNMPLFLEPGQHIEVPLEQTYQAAFAAVPRRWQRELI